MIQLLQRPIKQFTILFCIFLLLLAQIFLFTKNHIHAASITAPPSLSENWAGYEVQGKPHMFNRGEITFIIPTLNPSIQGDVAEWVGLGGDPSLALGGNAGTILVQAGADSTFDASGIQHNTVWWEVFPAPSNTINSFQVNTGDKIYVYVESNVNKSGLNIFTIQDKTTSQSITIKKPANRQTTTDGASAECIVERPAPSATTLFALPDFGSEPIVGCDVGTVNSNHLQPIGSFPMVTKIDMIEGSIPTVNGRLISNVVTRNGLTRNPGATAPTLLATTGDLVCPHKNCFFINRATSSSRLLNATLKLMQFPVSLKTSL